MNRHQQRVMLLFGLLLISAALLGRANSSEAQASAHAARSEVEARDSERGLVLTLGDVVFEAGKASLQPSAMTAIENGETYVDAERPRSSSSNARARSCRPASPLARPSQPMNHGVRPADSAAFS